MDYPLIALGLAALSTWTYFAYHLGRLDERHSRRSRVSEVPHLPESSATWLKDGEIQRQFAHIYDDSVDSKALTDLEQRVKALEDRLNNINVVEFP